jgi:phosphatidate phosphatase APP1
MKTSTSTPTRIIGSYFRDVDGWQRMKSLDRECSEQRMLQTWTSNKNCRGRNSIRTIQRNQQTSPN